MLRETEVVVTQRRKLIEVSLPLEAINRAALREKSIRHGHPSTLHLWWARRPLAVARAVLFAQLVDDPSSHPDRFPTEEAQRVERERLHRLIEELVTWESTGHERLFAAAACEIRASLGGSDPVVLDPFAGGGSIPLEAKRLGLRAQGNDLNPLPVLINTVMLDLVDRFGLTAPVSGEQVSGAAAQPVAASLAADLRHFAALFQSRVEQQVEDVYPRTAGGGEPLVYLWARTVTCPNPVCAVEVPLAGSWKVSARPGSRVHLRPVLDRERGVFDVDVREGTEGEPAATLRRTGGACPSCDAAFPLAYVKQEGSAGRLGSRLLAIQQRHGRTRTFVPATEAQRAAARVDPGGAAWLDAELSTHSQYMAPPRYGMTRFRDLFSGRQSRVLSEFVSGLDAVQAEVEAAAIGAGLVDDGVPYAEGGAGARAYADAMRILLSLGVGRLVNRQSTLCIWNASGVKVEQVFARQAYAMSWLYAEANPFAGASGSFSGQVDFLAKAIAALPVGRGRATQGPAQELRVPPGVVVSTDPPYYDNVPYADLSDFFLVWLRAMLGETLPIFPTVLSPKRDELVADYVRWGGQAEARRFFQSGMRAVFARIAEAHRDDVPMTVYYAYKQAETTSHGVSSSGWATLLAALLETGWAVVGTWPMRTEQTGGLRELNRGALDSSIVIVCRRRAADAPATSRQGFLQALRAELPVAIRRLRQGLVAPVDQRQSTLGPGMAVFSRYSRVLEADGSPMSVPVAIALINEVLDDVLDEQEGDFDATTRFALAWYRYSGYRPGTFGEADRIARSRDTSIAAMQRAGVVKRVARRVELVRPAAVGRDRDGRADPPVSTWQTLHLVIKLLERDGVAAAGALLSATLDREDGAVEAESVRGLGHLLFHIAETNGWTRDALAFDTVVTSWPDLLAAARSGQG